MRVAWTFEDVHALEEYILPINPSEAQMPAMQKTFTPQPTAHGGQIFFQGRNRPQQISLTGTILTEEHYYALREWVKKEKQIRVSDDLGRVFWCYFKEFSPTRVKSSDYPWRHNFTLTGVVVSWETY